MPRIFDNIETSLLPALQQTLAVSNRADFCVGYFNLRGWKSLDSHIEHWSEDGQQCRLLVGMQRLPQEELRNALSLVHEDRDNDQGAAIQLKKRLAEEFRKQLTIGAPSNADEAGLRRLAAQIKAKKVVVKLFLRHPLHAKLYLLFRPDQINPIVGYLGSSNLTFSGLSSQGELNVDVMDHDACTKLQGWFEDRWNDRLCMDISSELVEIIETSWAREELVPPFHIYLKMAYHLSQEARTGLSEFRIPSDFGNKLFEFQVAAVKIAAHHLNKRGGVLIGDVVGLGKTLMATALARIFEDDLGLETLILCPKNLVPMWEDYRERYRLRGKVLSVSRVTNELTTLRRYRLVLIDESHNLRNRDGKRFRAIQEYIKANESRVILLSATPYNKTYLDLSNQLRLFLESDRELGIRPEKLLRELGETEFIRRHQCSIKSLEAFEKSEHPDDWRDLMRLYLVRRTRTFIKDNYAIEDEDNGKRKYLVYEDGSRAYFPDRVPKTLRFKIDEKDKTDQYAKLFAQPVVDAINALNLPRYGLGNYVAPTPHDPPTNREDEILSDLSRAGKRLMGFCRTNLFKRLESSGAAFLQSVERHILRNFIYIHAVENDLELPIGTQDAEMLDPGFDDKDEVSTSLFDNDGNDEDHDPNGGSHHILRLRTEEEFRQRAAEVYGEYRSHYQSRFRWIRSNLFVADLKKDLSDDANSLMKVLAKGGNWDPNKDSKLDALQDLIVKKHPNQKVLVFTQFADTVRYLEDQLKARGIQKVAGVTGGSSDPTTIAWRFSPESNEKKGRFRPEDELQVLVATDVLSEGQNLQDAHIVVNFDLPWAIIRLIQRAGRVDRIGQQSDSILCYSFLPADGVERIIRLRQRVRNRLKENAEVVGADEAFFEDDDQRTILDLYNEKTGILDGDDDTEVDLASFAFQIWKNAIDDDPSLEKTIQNMPDVMYSTRDHKRTSNRPDGVLVYVKTAEGNDALAYVNKQGESITESQYEILKAAECKPNTPALPRHDKHHELVKSGVEHIVKEEKRVGGQLGRPSGARFRTYDRLKAMVEEMKGTLLEDRELEKAMDDIYRFPLRPTATDTLNRQLRSGISDAKLAELVIALRQEDRLCIIEDEDQLQEPTIICSMGLFSTGQGD